MAIQVTSYPRIALIGNPSDGYFGKTIAFLFSDFQADVKLEESNELQIIPGSRDRLVFKNPTELINEIRLHGYYGGIRLMKATIRKFYDYCRDKGFRLTEKNFSIRYSTTIPERLGLAGSSAIVTAAMKALLQFHEVEIEKPLLANLILSVEKDELKIGAGLQDRVAQVYNCPVMMNFDKNLIDSQGFGEYIPFDKNILPSVYIAFRPELAEGSEITHNELAERFAKKESKVVKAIEQWKNLTAEVWEKLQRGDKHIDELMNKNFDIRRKICSISKGNIELIETARSVGVSAKFTGSGGAITGVYHNEESLRLLEKKMKTIGAVVIKPTLVG